MDGILLVDKPAGKTSHDVVAAIRRDIGGGRPRRERPKVGHAGTLDPFATGLLIVLVGRATRVQRILMAQRKQYVTRARFGFVSSTGDTEGEITETGRVPAEPIILPTGVVRQRPPAYSAIKIDGERAYEKARRGEEVDMPEREVVVHRFERPDPAQPDLFEIECSAGTYVRTLIADLGDAYCTELRRTAIGPFHVDAAGDAMVPLGEALAAVLPVIQVADAEVVELAHGRAIAASLPPGAEEAVALDEAGAVAILKPHADGGSAPVVGFRSA